MKKLLAILLLGLVFQSANAKTFDEIKSSGMLRIGVPADYAPLAYFDEQDKLIGFDVDMAKDF